MALKGRKKKPYWGGERNARDKMVVSGAELRTFLRKAPKVLEPDNSGFPVLFLGNLQDPSMQSVVSLLQNG